MMSHRRHSFSKQHLDMRSQDLFSSHNRSLGFLPSMMVAIILIQQQSLSNRCPPDLPPAAGALPARLRARRPRPRRPPGAGRAGRAGCGVGDGAQRGAAWGQLGTEERHKNVAVIDAVSDMSNMWLLKMVGSLRYYLLMFVGFYTSL